MNDEIASLFLRELAEINRNLKDLNKTMSALSTELAAVTASLNSIASGITSLDSQIQALNGGTGTLGPADQAALDAIATQSAALATAANAAVVPSA